MTLSLATIKKRKVQDLAALRSDSPGAGVEAALKLTGEAKSYGLRLKDFLQLAIDVRGSDNPEHFTDGNGLLNGYEAALSYLDLPVKNDFANGITLDLASDTFQTYTGVRALFPEVIDDMLKWAYRQDQFEKASALVGNSRTTDGVELLSTVVDDTAADYKVAVPVAEMARVPVKTIRASQKSVTFYKFGSGIRTSYEFTRRAKLDMMTPYAARIGRETEMSKVGVITSMLINGDTNYAAAPVVAQSSYNSVADANSTNGKISYQHLLAWLVARAQAGVPVDTVVGNWDSYLQWLKMFAVPRAEIGKTDAEKLSSAGFSVGGIPLLSGTVSFALSSTAPANQLIGYSKADTVEEMVENGSLIEESERAIQNQSITYVKTENSGYRLVFGDTRSIYNFGG